MNERLDIELNVKKELNEDLRGITNQVMDELRQKIKIKSAALTEAEALIKQRSGLNLSNKLGEV